MFFYLSKILWAFVQPLTFIGLLILLGLIFYKCRAGKRLLLVSAGLFVICGFLPVGPILIHYLENRIPAQSLPDKIDGIIVLGGALNTESSFDHNQPQFNQWAGRFFEMTRLSASYPQARIIYSGGAGKIGQQDYKETDVVRKMLTDMHIPLKNFIFESQSRTTSENVKLSKKLASPQVDENWVLITSAFHMPRAMSVFKREGWRVIPYPAGYIENRKPDLTRFMDISGNYWKLNIAAKEIIGIIAYQLSGRI